MSEREPDTTNVHYIDEYPELQTRVWLRRLHQDRAMGRTALDWTHQVIVLPDRTPPDETA